MKKRKLIKDIWSDKYNQYFRCGAYNIHKKDNNLFKFRNYYYDVKKDIMIHESVIEDYINNKQKFRKSKRKEAYIKKNNLKNVYDPKAGLIPNYDEWEVKKPDIFR